MTDDGGKSPMGLRIGDGGEGLDQRADWNGLFRVRPALGEDFTRVRVEQQVRKRARWELTIERGLRTLREDRWPWLQSRAINKQARQEQHCDDGNRHADEFGC